jgi:polyferredoxin
MKQKSKPVRWGEDNMFSKRISVRYIIQSIFILLTAFYVFAPFIIAERSWAEGLCPLGGLETLPYLIRSGVYLEHISSFNIGIMTALIILTLLFGRMFCSYICPLGSLQEWFGNLGKKFRLNKKIPESLEFILSKLKYVVLVVILAGTYSVAELIFRKYDPFYALLHRVNPVLNASFIILGLTLIGSIFINRLWCRYLCPIGAFVRVLSFFSLVKLVRDKEACINCKLCNTACPENIRPAEQVVLTKDGCTHCLDCVGVCPGGLDAMKLAIGKGKHKQKEIREGQ